MAAAIGLRKDFGAAKLRRLARATKDSGQARRLLALAAIYDGGSRTDAARLGAVGLQTIRDWVVRFNARGPAGVIDGKAPGHAPKLGPEQRAQLAELVETGPIPAAHGVVRWRLVDLMEWVFEEFGVSLSEATMSREMKSLGFRKLSARPRHYAQNEFAVTAFKKTSPPRWKRSARVSARA